MQAFVFEVHRVSSVASHLLLKKYRLTMIIVHLESRRAVRACVKAMRLGFTLGVSSYVLEFAVVRAEKVFHGRRR